MDLNHICAAMFFSALLMTPLYGQSRQFDLKGDVLGETVPQFKARHPQATCSRFSDVEIECRDSSASFAGHTPYLYYNHEGDCDDCGLSADFFHGKLTFVGYVVSNGGYSGGDVMALLTKKFGKATSGGSGDGVLVEAEWRNSIQRISLHIDNRQPPDHTPEIRVHLEYIKDPADNDI